MSQNIPHWDPQSRSKISRRDLMLDEDEDMHNLDYLQIKPTRNPFMTRSSDEMSQASSTVIHKVVAGDDDQQEHGGIKNNIQRLTPEALVSMASNTMDTDTLFQEREQVIPKISVQTEPAHQNSQEDESQDADDSYEYSNDIIDELTDVIPSPPSSPPRELAPGKLYALFDFNGPDPSHLELYKDDSVELLNDSDSYWWLVRKTIGSEVGFAPAEILETYEERLARLNCWKNEIIEKGSSLSYLSAEDLKEFEINSNNRYSSASLNRLNDSISFSNSDVYLNVANGSDNSLKRKSSLKRNKSVVKKSVAFVPDILPQLSELDDERSEVVSEAHVESTPLIINKNKRLGSTNFMVRNLDSYIPEVSHQNSTTDNDSFKSDSEREEDGDDDEEEDLMNSLTSDRLMDSSPVRENTGVPNPSTPISIKPNDNNNNNNNNNNNIVGGSNFAAPNAVFMTTQDSIGSYSPDSIDYSSDNQSSPTLNKPISFLERREKFLEMKKEKLSKLNNKKSNIPLSAPRLDIASSMQMLDDLIKEGDSGNYSLSDYEDATDENADDVDILANEITLIECGNSFDNSREISQSPESKSLDEKRTNVSSSLNSSSLSLQICTSGVSSNTDTPSTSTSLIVPLRKQNIQISRNDTNDHNNNTTTTNNNNNNNTAESVTAKTSPDRESVNTWTNNSDSSSVIDSSLNNISVANTSTESSKASVLHPVTSELFNPLFNQLDQLEQMLTNMVTQ